MEPEATPSLGERTELTPATGSAARLSPIQVEQFDEYTLLARVGQGGMAEVFLALSEGPTGFRKLVAVKRLHRHLQEDPEAVEMFLREGSIAARLQHPNIVQTHKAGCFQGQHFLAMEYLEGQPLNRVLRRMHAEGAQLPPTVVVRLIADALEGLHHAHEARDLGGEPLALIHRDISPHNLFVTFDGHVKLIDFGVAKLSALPSQTRAGFIKGKLTYMAPEQALGEELDRRADLWSIGITLRECLSGQRLFAGGSDREVLRAAMCEEIPPLCEVAPEIPAELSRIVDRALQRDRSLRFSTALELKEALEGWLLAQHDGRLRATLAATMRALFHDVIEQRQKALRACLQRVEADRVIDGAAVPVVAGPSAPGVLAPVYRSARPSQPLTLSRKGRSRWKQATLLFAVVAAALLALVGGNHSPEPGLAHAGAQEGSANKTAREPAAAAVISTPPTRPSQVATYLPVPAQHAPAASTQAAKAAHSARRARRGHVAEVQKADEASAEVQGGAEPASARGREVRATGRLMLDSTPYAIVSLGDKRLGITPLDVELSATTHILTLRNPELGIETTYRVTIPPRGSVNQRVALD